MIFMLMIGGNYRECCSRVLLEIHSYHLKMDRSYDRRVCVSYSNGTLGGRLPVFQLAYYVTQIHLNFSEQVNPWEDLNSQHDKW